MRRKLEKVILVGVAALATLFGASNVAVANPVDKEISEDKMPIVGAEIFSGNDTLHAGIMEVFGAQLAQGKVVYTVNSAGKYLYQTEVNLKNGQIVQFIYETESNSEQAALLAGAIRSIGSFRAGGNEWHPKIWAGSDNKGRWVRFNRAAQGLIIGSSGTALKIAICAIPGVNVVGCAVVWGATTVAKQVIKRIGRCTTGRPWPYVYPGNIGASSCRS